MTERTSTADVSQNTRTDLDTSRAARPSALGGTRQRLQSLYPVSTRRGVSPGVAVAGALFVAMATVASLARVAGPGALESMWAEDGAGFYQTTFHQGFFSALFTPDNGYLEFLPRLLIGLISFLPVSRVAAAVSLTGAALSSGMALLVYHASAEHIRSRTPRACLAVATALLMVGAGEVADNIVNLQWYLLYVTFWMFLWNPRATGRRAVAAVVLFLAASSDPISTAFLSPILLARLWCRPWKESRWQLGGLALGLVFQAIAALHGNGGSRTLTADYSLTFAGRSYLKDVAGQALISQTELTQLGFGSTRIAPAIGLVLLVIAIAGGGTLFRTRGLLVVLCVGSSIVLSALLVTTAGYSLPRYCVVPALLLVTAFAVLADTDAFGRLPALVLCVLLGVNVYANYPIGLNQLRAQSPSWSTQVEHGKHACEQNPTLGSVTVQTAPGGGWKVAVPCSALVPDTDAKH